MLWLLLILLFPAFVSAQTAVAEPECPYTGHASCFTATDENRDGLATETAPAAAFQVEGSDYAIDFANAIILTPYVSAVDTASATGTSVSKALGSSHIEGEIALTFDVSADNYLLYLLVHNPKDSPASVWVKTASSHGVVFQNTNRMFVQPTSGFAWVAVGPSGIPTTFALNGPGAFFIKSNDQVKFVCGFLTTSTDPLVEKVCPGETPDTPIPDYVAYKLSGSAPASCADAQFTAANVLTYSGTATTTDAAPTVKILHDATKFYICMTQADTDLRANVASNDTSDIFNGDRLELLWCDTTTTGPLSSTCFKFAVTVRDGTYSANYPDATASVTQSLSEACDVSATGSIATLAAAASAGDTGYSIFCSVDAGFSIVDGTMIRANLQIGDWDGSPAAQTRRIHKGTSLNDIAQGGLWLLTGTTVPGAPADTTDPVVTSPAIVQITPTSATCTATTDEAGTARCKATDSSSGDQFIGLGTTCINLACSGTLTGLTPSRTYNATIEVTDAAGNVGVSATVPFSTPADSQVAGYFTGISTWRQPIASTPSGLNTVYQTGASADQTIIGDIQGQVKNVTFSRTDFGNAICTASTSDPLITVSGASADAIKNGWHQGRMPATCFPPGGGDGWTTIINEDDGYIWELYGATRTNPTTWSAARHRKWLLSGRGVLTTQDSGLTGVNTWVCATSSKIQATVTKDDIDSGEIRHALSFAYHNSRDISMTSNPRLYPCHVSIDGPCTRATCGILGERMMLDPSINVDAMDFGCNPSRICVARIVAKAAQKYGIIFSYGNCTTCGGQIQFQSHNNANFSWTDPIYDFSMTGFTSMFLGNIKRIPCVASFGGEC